LADIFNEGDDALVACGGADAAATDAELVAETTALRAEAAAAHVLMQSLDARTRAWRGDMDVVCDDNATLVRDALLTAADDEEQ
jgi:hypothetical protein